MGYLIRFFFVILLSNTVGAQISFFNYYSDNGVDRGEGIVQLEDSSYVITGSSSSFGDGSSQAFLMQIDSSGNFQWSNHYGGAGSESGRRVLYTKDFGFFICGFTNSFGNGGFDNYLAKIDESGLLEWEKAIGGAGWEKVHDAALTRDTGVLMVGESSSNNTNKDIYIARTDIGGDTLWTKTLGGSGDDYASDVLQIDDSTFIVVGRSYVEDSLLTKVWATKIGDDGTIYWEKNFGNEANSWANGVAFSGGELRIVGGSEGVNCIGVDPYTCIITKNGAFWGEYVSHDNGDSDLISIINFGPSQELYIPTSVANEWTFLEGRDIKIDRLSNSFSWVEEFYIGREYDDVSNQIINTNDGSAITVGYSTNVVSGGNDIYVCKIGPNNDYPDTENGAVNNNVVTVIESENQSLELKVYPNPSNGVVTIKSLYENVEKIQVLDMGGGIVLEKFNMSSVDLSSFENGYYILLLEIEDHVVSRKVVIQH
tara:strand:+ start:7867 stop:9315 length:1449 start_codon:yes stop_codon:yes gene_type:complete